jgi:hypothetical protein
MNFSDVVDCCLLNASPFRYYVDSLKTYPSDEQLKSKFQEDCSNYRYMGFCEYIKVVKNMDSETPISKEKFQEIANKNLKQNSDNPAIKIIAVGLAFLIIAFTAVGIVDKDYTVGQIISLILFFGFGIGMCIYATKHNKKMKENLKDEKYVITGYNTYLDIYEIAKRLKNK